MNIFEGARRIAKVIAAISIFIAGAVSFTGHPYFNRYYTGINRQVVEVAGCSGQPSFLTHVKGTPDWSRVSFCGYTEGPSEVDLSDKTVKQINEEISARKWSDVGETMGWTAAGLIIGWLCVWCVGWIVRGFMGIPRGQDYRIQPITK